VGTAEACRQVGIGRKTGYRWRAEHGGVPPERVAESVRSNRYLSLLERQRIATLQGQGLGVREIARRLDRAPSTVSRELRRNTAAHDRAYDGDLAHARARTRGRRARSGLLRAEADLRALVQAKLELEWSPEQIAGWLRTTFPDRRSWWVCHETIYQALYRGGQGGLARELTRRLRTGRPLRRRRRRSTERSPRFVVPAQLIGARSAAAADRSRIGDWEGDLIVGAMSRSAIATLVDRRSRYLRLVHLPGGHTADDLLEAMSAVLKDMPAATRRTLTWDQGSEMARHADVATFFDEGVFFAPPASPWMRGTNENTNGLLRQYFPKGKDLRSYTAEDLRRVEARLNSRPRKLHRWQTPEDVFKAAVAQ
jgi:IS30 family transposase